MAMAKCRAEATGCRGTARLQLQGVAAHLSAITSMPCRCATLPGASTRLPSPCAMPGSRARARRPARRTASIRRLRSEPDDRMARPARIIEPGSLVCDDPHLVLQAPALPTLPPGDDLHHAIHPQTSTAALKSSLRRQEAQTQTALGGGIRYGGLGLMIYWQVERSSVCIHSRCGAARRRRSQS